MIMTKFRYFLAALTSLLLITVLVTVGIGIHFWYFPVVNVDTGVKYTVKEGSSIGIVIEDLSSLKLIKHPTLFRFLVKIKKASSKLKAGEYLFAKGTTEPKILDQITTGKGLVYYVFMIVPGTTFKEIRHLLDQDENIRHSTQNLNESDIMKLLGQPKLKAEGEFFADSYFFTKGTEDIALLKRAYKAMQQKLEKAWLGRSRDIPFKNSYEALIAASLVEKETYFKEEMPRIAGVLVNRLKKSMLLQFDPTVIYGIGTKYDGTIHRRDLLAKNPYNTYINKGLPPTPIATPSMGAILSVLHPEKHDYYYFVANHARKSLFSHAFPDHNKMVQAVRKDHWFFNYHLTRSYFMKIFSYSMSHSQG